jgi:threonine dehydrogenase-like Zn-dependent dehydrogenase
VTECAAVRQLLLKAPGQLEWVEVPEPDLGGAGEALVRPLRVATCDLDGPMARGEAPSNGPVALGHECVAEVVAVGGDVGTVAVGDLVAVPFQINCGTCEACRRGSTGNCESVPALSMYGFGALGGEWGGMLCDLVRVPFAEAMLVALPPGVDPSAAASVSDNLPDAWRTVAPHLRKRPGADVLVFGGGARSIGLYSVAIARALGAGTITYMDTDPRRLSVASDLGAEAVEGPPPRKLPPREIVVDAGFSHESLSCACRSTVPEGDCTHVGILYEPETPVPLFEMYTYGVHFHVGRAMARAAMPDVLELIASGRLDPTPVTDEVVPFEAAAERLLQPHDKLVFAAG